MRRIVPRESRDLNESCNKILRFAQDGLLSLVGFLAELALSNSLKSIDKREPDFSLRSK